MEIIDVHTHAFPDFLADSAIEKLEEHSNGATSVTVPTIANLKKWMKQCEISRSVICSIATAEKQVMKIIDWSEQIQSKQIIPFLSITPEFKDLDLFFSTIQNKGFKGLKIHPQYQNIEVNDPQWNPIYQKIEENDLVLLFHAGYDIAFPDDEKSSPEKILDVHQRFPKMKIIAAHFGGWKAWDKVEKYLIGKDIYLETSYTFGYLPDEDFMRMLNKHSRDRVLFGTDFPWKDPTLDIEKLHQLPIDSYLLENIFSKNASELLNLSLT